MGDIYSIWFEVIWNMLDLAFGPCLGPARAVSAAELSYSPQTLQKLTRKTSRTLKRYMSSADGGLLIPRILHKHHNILWIVDCGGEVWFALEETVDERTGGLLYPFPRAPDIRRPPNHVKLGHPALVRAQQMARIAGEIIFDPDFGATSNWVLNNASGRFGIRPHLTIENLESVRGAFLHFGIALELEFIEA